MVCGAFGVETGIRETFDEPHYPVKYNSLGVALNPNLGARHHHRRPYPANTIVRLPTVTSIDKRVGVG